MGGKISFQTVVPVKNQHAVEGEVLDLWLLVPARSWARSQTSVREALVVSLTSLPSLKLPLIFQINPTLVHIEYHTTDPASFAFSKQALSLPGCLSHPSVVHPSIHPSTLLSLSRFLTWLSNIWEFSPRLLLPLFSQFSPLTEIYSPTSPFHSFLLVPLLEISP